MSVEQFFNLFLIELEENKELWRYYKFLHSEKNFAFRKAYFCQRLQYIADHIGDKEQDIWDCGCGYGTTALFLAMNGYKVYGTTLEFYFDSIEKRKLFWSKYGNADLFSCSYENFLDAHYKDAFSTIILQDTLHHLEPMPLCVSLLFNSLRGDGELLIVEENGKNIVQNLKLLLQRGWKKKIEIYDERLHKKIPFGNENIRSLKKWTMILSEAGFKINPSATQYIRLFPPFYFTLNNYGKVIKRETSLVKRLKAVKDLFYFGINFLATKPKSTRHLSQ